MTMSSELAWNELSKLHTKGRTALRHLRHRLPIGAALIALLSACSSDKSTTAPGKSSETGNNGGATGESKEFESCIASLKPLCKTKEMDTAEKIQVACKATEFIPIPLTDGSSYGPVTIQGGPYGGKLEWNQGANTEFVNPVNTNEPLCLPAGIDTFKEPSQVTDDLKNTRDLKYELYTIFHPACMKDGETYPVITWANGTCGLTHGYALLLTTIASHGFVIVASNSTWTGTPPTNGVQARAIDYAKYLNEDSSSMFYGKLDLDKVGAMGHSQGAGATRVAAADPRVKSVIFWNTGTTDAVPFLNVSADRDVGGGSVTALQAATNAAMKPGAWIYYHQVLETGGGSTGHLVLMEQPDRVSQMAVDWWKWQLNGDDDAKKTFVGADCGLCNQADKFEYGVNSHLE
jgi:hypothetical protein